MSTFLRLKFPTILGKEFSGEVVRCGPKVTGFKVGDKVFGLKGNGNGAFAEYAVYSESEMCLKPDQVPFEEATCIGIAAVTAWQCLAVRAGLEKRKEEASATANTTPPKILIQGAAGGVGHYAVQLAKYFGCEVYATCGTDKVDFVKSLGADHVIDYKKENFEERVKNLDIVLDTVCAEGMTEKSMKVLKPTGRYMTIVIGDHKVGFSDILKSTAEIASYNLYSLFGASPKYDLILNAPNQDYMRKCASLMANGVLKTEISHRFPLSEMRKAHEQIDSHHTRGKVVIDIIQQ
eukprot:GEZU01024511.1.p1 GENE.GEZU01024511.1~~GEZU01024511.1.p1  ORF type:complete len:292 (+),score=73.14 GEZU01024511.1:261-1136(+)